MDVTSEIEERLLSLGYVVTTADDSLITFLIAKKTESICNSCNLESVPDGLHYTFIDMVCSDFMLGKLATDGLDIERSVKAIAEGDTTVTFSDSTSKESQLKQYLTDMGSEKGLVKYRKLTW